MSVYRSQHHLTTCVQQEFRPLQKREQQTKHSIGQKSTHFNLLPINSSYDLFGSTFSLWISQLPLWLICVLGRVQVSEQMQIIHLSVQSTNYIWVCNFGTHGLAELFVHELSFR